MSASDQRADDDENFEVWYNAVLKRRGLTSRSLHILLEDGMTIKDVLRLGYNSGYEDGFVSGVEIVQWIGSDD
jgi:hypothetical protein